MADRADQENTPLPSSSQDVPPSSPLVPSSPSRKQRKPPTVTPKRFNKFFNPLLTSAKGSAVTSSGRELRDITRNAANHARSATGLGGLADTRPSKRRKTSLPDEHYESDTKVLEVNSSPPEAEVESGPEPEPSEGEDMEPPTLEPIRITRAKQQHVYPDWQSHTLDFWSGPDLSYNFGAPGRPRFMPFSMAACNTNSLVAIGGEYGYVRLLDTADGGRTKFSENFLTFRANLDNAILEMAFSSTDEMLALAGGDQAAHIMDMQTRQEKARLTGHHSSLRQVAFQPGNDNIVASCARDGTIQLWDIRTPSNNADLSLHATASQSRGPAQKRVPALNSFTWGYREPPPKPGSLPSTPTNRGPPSMTCLSFLSASRPHLLVSATDHKAEIRLWDVRHRQRTRDSADGSAPVSATAPIPSHVKNRHFGITSLALGADGTRLYSVCRNGTIYAYATSHLVLGSASSVFSNAVSDPSPSSSRRARHPTWTQGAGPLYGLRHPHLYASSFYMRCAIRKPVADKPELLAVSSQDPTPILFPTDETLLRKQTPVNAANTDDCPSSTKRGASIPPSATALLSRSMGSSTPQRPRGLNLHGGAERGDGFPVYDYGTALVGGHGHDVTGVAWTSEGDLVSISDDWVARLWRERPGVVQTPDGPTRMERPARWLRNQPAGREWRYAFAQARDDSFDKDD